MAIFFPRCWRPRRCQEPGRDPEDLANQPDAAVEDGFDAVLEDDDAEGEEEQERRKMLRKMTTIHKASIFFCSILHAVSFLSLIHI